jgi:hypothetical protein
MEKYKFLITLQLHEQLQTAFRELNCGRVSGNQNLLIIAEPRFHKIVYNPEHDLMAIEYWRNEFSKGLPEGYFDRDEVQCVLQNHTGQQVEFSDLGDRFCFYFWLKDAKIESILQTIYPEQFAQPVSVAG